MEPYISINILGGSIRDYLLKNKEWAEKVITLNRRSIQRIENCSYDMTGPKRRKAKEILQMLPYVDNPFYDLSIWPYRIVKRNLIQMGVLAENEEPDARHVTILIRMYKSDPLFVYKWRQCGPKIGAEITEFIEFYEKGEYKNE